MYRQQSEKKSSENDQFVGRLLGWPVIATAVDQVNALYTGTKEKNRLLKVTMETAESSVGVIVSTAAPVVSKFEKQISALNGLACNQLDKLEQSYPIVKKPTDEVLQATKDLCSTAVKPLVNGVSSAKQYGIDKVSGVRSYTGEKLNDVKNYGLNKVNSVAKMGNEQMAKVMSAALAQSIALQVDNIFNTADKLVDSYLPPDEEEVSKSEEKAGDRTEVPVVSKAFQLTTKVRKRACARVLKQMGRVQARSKETISKLNFTVDLIEYARNNFNEAKDKVHLYWDEINKTEDEVAKEASAEMRTHDETTFERKAVATARHLTQKLKSTLSWLHIPQFASTASDLLNERIQNLQATASSLANIFSKETVDKFGLPKAALDNARNLSAQIYSGLRGLIPVLPEHLLHFKAKSLEETPESASYPSEDEPDKEEDNEICQNDN